MVAHRPTLRMLVGVAALTASSLLLSSCDSAPEFSVADRRQVLGEAKIATLSTSNPNRTEAMSTDLPAKRQFRRSIDLSLKPGSKLKDDAVRDKIYELYKIKKVEDEKICIITVEVPPGQSYEYDLEWQEAFREGVVTARPNGEGELYGTYKILEDLLCQTVAMRAKSPG